MLFANLPILTRRKLAVIRGVAFGLAFVVASGSVCRLAWAQSITVINPGGEAYPSNPTGNLDTNINPGGVEPISTTGWDSTVLGTSGRAVQALDRGNAFMGDIRLAFGATAAHVTANPTETPETAILFQETSHVVAAGQEFVMNFVGQGFFNFDNSFDDLASFFGYVDGGNQLVQVDTKAHTNVTTGTWTPAGHSFIVPGGSPLIGENLTIGFFTQSGNGGGFSSIDEVTLMLGAGNPPCDADGNGICNFADVQRIADNFLEMVPTSTLGDLDDNGLVDFGDFRIWKDATGFGGSLADALAAAVPEPSTASLAAMTSVLLLWRARRGK